jgi:PilZ domain-containing protein
MELSAEFFEQTIAIMKGDCAPGKQSKRAQPRVGIRCRIKLHSVGTGGASAPVEAWTRDISRTGVGMICSRRVNAGGRYCLMLSRKSGDAPLLLYCTVKNCSELAPGIFAIGAVFDSVSDPAAEAKKKTEAA